MIIATNVTRDYIGGITRSNISLIDFLYGKVDGVVGLEINPRQYMLAPTAFQHIPAKWFNHHIVNI